MEPAPTRTYFTDYPASDSQVFPCGACIGTEVSSQHPTRGKGVSSMFTVRMPDGTEHDFNGDRYEIDTRTVKQVLSAQYPVLESIPGDGTWEGDTLVFARPTGGTKG